MSIWVVLILATLVIISTKVTYTLIVSVAVGIHLARPGFDLLLKFYRIGHVYVYIIGRRSPGGLRDHLVVQQPARWRRDAAGRRHWDKFGSVRIQLRHGVLLLFGHLGNLKGKHRKNVKRMIILTFLTNQLKSFTPHKFCSNLKG